MVAVSFTVQGQQQMLNRVNLLIASTPRFKKELGKKIGLRQAQNSRTVLRQKLGGRFGSGRLMATIGNFDRRFLRPTHPMSRDVSESDAIFEVDITESGELKIQVGSALVYARLINDGFNYVGPRVVPILTPSGIVFRVIQEFEFDGHRFIEEGLEMTRGQLAEIGAPIMRKHLAIMRG